MATLESGQSTKFGQVSGADVDLELLKDKLSHAIERICQECFIFVEYVSVIGKLTFKVDETQKIDVGVSQMILPGPMTSPAHAAFSGDTKVISVSPLVIKPQITNKTRIDALTKSPAIGQIGAQQMTLVKKTPQSKSKRKRGRPRKAEILEVTDSNDNEEDQDKSTKTDVLVKVESIEDIGEATQQVDFISDTTFDNDDEVPDNDEEDAVVKNDDEDDNDDNFVPEGDEETEVEDDYNDDDKEYKPKRNLRKIENKKVKNEKLIYSDNPLECYRCKFIAETTELLKQHKIKTHGKFVCAECPYVSDSNSKYQIHFQAKHTDTKLPCGLCNKEFTHIDSLKKHRKIMHSDYWKCPLCEESRTHPSKKRLLMHMRSEHQFGEDGNDINVFTCDYCKMMMATETEAELHNEKMHTHICAVCQDKFETVGQLVKHKLATHPDIALKCDICSRLCPTKSALHKHLLRHKDREGAKVKCDECGKEFTGKGSLFHHKRGMHGKEKKYRCELCDKTFNFHHSLKLHKYKHSGQRPHQCMICTKSYLTSNHLKNHVEAVHSGKRKYVCPVCNKGFTYDNSLRMHMLLHENTRPFLCEICSKSFVSKSALKAHEELHTSELHQCTVCQKMYNTRMLLRAHMRRHTDEGHRYMCDICGNTFMYKSTLAAHQTVHGDTRTYECKACNKTFKTYATLYSHRLVHEDSNPHPCSVCGKGFKTRERMKAHERRHTGEKPYKCELCGSCFPDRGGLSKHNKTVHARKPRFQCPSCGKLANRADNLRVHMKMHNDPALADLKFEELLIKRKEGEPEPDYDDIPIPMPRRRRSAPLKRETNSQDGDDSGQVNAALNVIGQIQQNQESENLRGAVQGSMAELVGSDITFPGLMVSHLQKFQQHGGHSPMGVVDGRAVPMDAVDSRSNNMGVIDGRANQSSDTAKHNSMQKQLSQSYDKSLQKHLTAIASNLHQHQNMDIQNSNGELPRLHQQEVLITNAAAAAIAAHQHHQPVSTHHSVLTNPLLQLAEVMSGAQHNSSMVSGSNQAAPVGLAYSTIQQYHQQHHQQFSSSGQSQQQQQSTSTANYF